MKIVIIPSANAIQSNNFSTILTKQGFDYADKLSAIIHEINPDMIYCSPFVRALQTIFPYCVNHKKNVKVDYSLCPLERFDSKYQYFTPSLTTHKEHFSYLFKIIDNNYKTKIFPSNIKRNESCTDIGNRLYPFLYALKKKYENKKITIVLVTHLDIVPTIINYLENKNKIMDYNQSQLYSITI